MHRFSKNGNSNPMRREQVKKFLKITIAAFIYSFGIGALLEPNNLAPGGVTGISIMLNYLFGIPTGVGMFLINIPILWLGYRKLGKKLIYLSVYVLALASVLVDAMAETGWCVTRIPLLAALFGGAMVGAGLGVVFRGGGTTGGADILVRLIKLKYRHIKTGIIFLAFDVTVVGISALIFKDTDLALYAGLSVMSASMVMNKVLYGGDEAKFIYIVSDRYSLIAGKLLGSLNVGATYLKGRGAYSGTEKDIIMCVIRRQQLPQAEEIVKEIDENAFMIVTSATEIFGEGYKKHGTIY